MVPRNIINCESCRRRISTNPGFIEASEYGLTRGTRFIGRRLQMVAVAGLLCIWWCVLATYGRIFILFFLAFFFALNAHGLRKYEAASSASLLLLMRQGEANETVFCL